MATGENTPVRLRGEGVDVGGSTGLVVNPHHIWIPTKDHPLYDSRSKDPVDRKMVDDIKAGRFKPVIGVREEGFDTSLGRTRLALVYGNHRLIASRVARDEQEKDGLPEARLFRVGVTLVKGDHKTCYEAKIAENGGRLPETPRTLAEKFERYQKLGGSLEQGAELYRIDLTLAEKVICFHELPERVQAKFDDHTLPLDVLPYFFALAPELREGLLNQIEGSGAKAPEEVREAARKGRNNVVRKAKKDSGAPLRAYAMPAPIVKRVIKNLATDDDGGVKFAIAVMLWQRGDGAQLKKLDKVLYAKLEAARGTPVAADE